MTASADLAAWPTDSCTLRQFLGVNSDAKFRCHGKTQADKPCKNPISQKISSQVSILLAKITKCGSFESASTLLNEVARLIMCHPHHGKQSPACFKAWEAKSTALDLSFKTEHDDGAAISSILPKSDTPLRQETRLEAVASDTTVKKEEDISTHNSAALKDSKPKTPNPAPLRQPTHHKFEAFGNPISTVTINRHIRNIINRKPCKKERENPSGSVYMYIFPSNYHDRAPHLKIGNTNDLSGRMDSWRRRCGYNPKLLVDFRAELYVKVERLVHATLRNERMREPSCPRCGIEHLEWFNVRSSKASSIIATWASWTRQEPYNEDGTLKKVWADRLERVDLTNPHCWHDFVDGTFDEDDSSEGSDLDLLEGVDLSDFSDDEFF